MIVLDKHQITELTPHGPNFQCVDRLYRSDDQWWSEWSIPTDNPAMVDHFPPSGIVPGVILIEAMAQTGGLIAHHVFGSDDDVGALVLAGVEGVRLRGFVVAGELLRLDLRNLEVRGRTGDFRFAASRSSDKRRVATGTVRIAWVESLEALGFNPGAVLS